MAVAAEAGTFRLADVFSKALPIYGRRFGPFIVLTVIAQIPQYLTLSLIDVIDSRIGWTVVLYLVNLACSSIAGGAVTYGVVQELRGRRFSVVDSIQIALNRFLPMIGVAICTTILIGLAPILLIVLGLTVFRLPSPTLLLLLIVPGLTAGSMMACALFVSMPACVVEHAGVFESMARSRFLTKGCRWQVFGLSLLILVAAYVLWMLVGIIVAGMFRWLGISDGVAAFIAMAAIWAIVSSFNGVIAGVFYYQLRVAKEGVDIDKIASVFD